MRVVAPLLWLLLAAVTAASPLPELRLSGSSFRSRYTGHAWRLDVWRGRLPVRHPSALRVSRPARGVLRLEMPTRRRGVARLQLVPGGARWQLDPGGKARIEPRRSLIRASGNWTGAAASDVVRQLARTARRNVFLGAGFEGRIWLHLRDVPVNFAVQEVVRQTNPAFQSTLEHSIQVVSRAADPHDSGAVPVVVPTHPRPVGGVEILLKHQKAADVMEFLSRQYRGVRLVAHPFQEGFYAIGPLGDVGRLKRDVELLDVPIRQARQVQEEVELQHANLEDVRDLLTTMVPDVRVIATPDRLVLRGEEGAVEQALELLRQIDQPLDRVLWECKVGTAPPEAWLHPISVDHVQQGCDRDGEDGMDLPQVRASRLPRKEIPATSLRTAESQSGEARIRVDPPADSPFGRWGVGDHLERRRYDGNRQRWLTDRFDLGLRADISDRIEGVGVISQISLRLTLPVLYAGSDRLLTSSSWWSGTVHLEEGDSLVLDGLLQESELAGLDSLLPDLPHVRTWLSPEKRHPVIYLTPNVFR